MKLRIDTKVIAKLNPCRDRFDNWKKHYGKFIEQTLAADDAEAYRNACNSLDGFVDYDPELVEAQKVNNFNN